MRSRKALQFAIKELEAKLQENKTKVVKNKNSLLHWAHANRYLLLTMLIPPFLAGWHEGNKENKKEKIGGKNKGRIKRFTQFMLKTALGLIHLK